MINIDAVAGAEQPEAAFTPQNQAANVGDLIYWCNTTSDPHWPAPVIGGSVVEDSWMDYAIPGKLPNEPAPTSQQAVSFSSAGTYNYACAIHQEERGTITVT
jgi:plastocyanin